MHWSLSIISFWFIIIEENHDDYFPESANQVKKPEKEKNKIKTKKK